jgi:hypothetical protein
MAEECHVLPIDAESNSHVVVCGPCVELGAGVGRRSTERHVATVLGEKNSVAGAMLDGSSPVELPYSEIRVSVEGYQHTWSFLRISDQETRQPLSIDRLIRHAATVGYGFDQAGWLKEDSLLLAPQQGQRTQNEREDY